ncbi:MAG TPA: M14 metallopeptidase family protein, partial [Bacillota bacterium]|nr:M14 metallopeptidase family protein [Bacillota bacterium]
MEVKRLQSPEEFFGFQMGTDRKIARWDKIVEYFWHMQSQSDKIVVTDLGPSTEGHPFLTAIITSVANHARLEELRQMNLAITDPRGLDESQLAGLIGEGKVVIVQSMSLHATEIGGTQMAPELAYNLLSDEGDEVARILDNVIFIMVPCFNPDGQIMVTDWYDKWVNTDYEGSMPPWLYHKYTGHDNNRDAFMQNIVESRYMGQLMLRDWRPQAYQDHHHMGSYGARLFIAPYSEPLRPDTDPLIWRELSWYGSHMAYRLEEAGKQGILHGAQFPGWGHYGFHWLTNHHNIAGMLTESASAKLASPLYIDPTQLIGADGKNMPEYEAQSNFPSPWPGGWWRLRDIVEQMKISAYALLDAAARNRETVLRNACNKARNQSLRGALSNTAAFIIPTEQHDSGTAAKLVGVLLNQGIEVHTALRPFVADGRTFDTGSAVVFPAQPKLGAIKALLQRTAFPLNSWTTDKDGSPKVFDAATDTVAEYMGVKVCEITEPFEAELEVLTSLPMPSVSFVPGAYGHVFAASQNDSYRLLNRLLAAGIPVWRLDDIPEELPAGGFWIKSEHLPAAAELALDFGMDFHALPEEYLGDKTPVKQLRVGVFQRFWGGNSDEGWTRLVLEQFEFPYETIFDADIQSGTLRDRVDVLIIPSDNNQLLVDITNPDMSNPWTAVLAKRAHTFPVEYRSGLGAEGKRTTADFVTKGGRLLALNAACDFAIETCGLEVKNILSGVDAKDFYTHGSTLQTRVDTSHRLAYGMPPEVLVLHWDSPAFAITDTLTAEKYETVLAYPAKDILQGGLLVGEKRIRNKAAMVVAKKGEGEVVLYGF